MPDLFDLLPRVSDRTAIATAMAVIAVVGLIALAYAFARKPVSARVRWHDLSMRVWGRDFNVVGGNTSGVAEIALWATPMPSAGDMLILARHPDGDTSLYKILKIDPCANPTDMAFAKVKFSPGRYNVDENEVIK